jgi:Ca2+/Na+ antiporter
VVFGGNAIPTYRRRNNNQFSLGGPMLLAAFYVFAIACIILYYTGHLKRWNCEWILIVLAVAVFPAVLYL